MPSVSQSVQAEKLPEAPPEGRVPQKRLFCLRALPETVQACFLPQGAREEVL